MLSAPGRHAMASATVRADSTATLVYSPQMPVPQPADRDFKAILPEEAVQPYDRPVNIMEMPVPMGPRKDSLSFQVHGWTRHVHPSGRVYMYHEGQRIVVDGGAEVVFDWNNMPTPVAEASVSAAKDLWGMLKGSEMGDYELSLRVTMSPTATTIHYYFVDWLRRSIFWIHARDSPRPVASLWHLYDVQELHFWTHVDFFPMHHALPPNAREEVNTIMAYHTIDAKTFKETTAPWKPEDAHMLAKALPDASASASSSPSRQSSVESDITVVNVPLRAISTHEGFSNASVARLWMQICTSRVYNFHGDTYARRKRTDRRHQDLFEKEPLKWLRLLLSFLLLGRPSRLYAELEGLFVDGIIYRFHWQAFIDNDVRPQLGNITTNSTALLAANLAFLALSGLSVTWKFLSLSSAVFSTAALITSIKLTSLSKVVREMGPPELSRLTQHKWFGLYSLALLFSLPITIFAWALLTFVSAVLGSIFEDWTKTLTIGIPFILLTAIPLLIILIWVASFSAGRNVPPPSFVPEVRDKSSALSSHPLRLRIFKRFSQPKYGGQLFDEPEKRSELGCVA